VVSASITEALVRRLRKTSGVTDEDIKAIYALPITVRSYSADQAIVREGDHPTASCLIADGFCIRAKSTSSGQRQILSIHIPGEIPDLQSLHLQVMDHDLITLTEARLGFISHSALRSLHRRRPKVAEVFWRDTLIDSSMFREWIVNVGQRPAPSRLLHTMAELRERLKTIGRVENDTFEMPLTQEQIGEAMGITAVHVSRVIKQLRADGVVDFQRGRVKVLDEAKFEELADFDNRYLHQSPAL